MLYSTHHTSTWHSSSSSHAPPAMRRVYVPTCAAIREQVGTSELARASWRERAGTSELAIASWHERVGTSELAQGSEGGWIGRGWPKQRSSGQPVARSGAEGGLGCFNQPLGPPSCLHAGGGHTGLVLDRQPTSAATLGSTPTASMMGSEANCRAKHGREPSVDSTTARRK